MNQQPDDEPASDGPGTENAGRDALGTDDDPERDAPAADEGPPVDLDFGETVYDADGNALGTVRGFGEDGFFVTTAEGIEGLSVEHVRAGHEYGEAELVWRCLACGEVGDLADWPGGGCPSCGAPTEELYYYTED